MRESSRERPAPSKLPGANEPCWCGSGTKYKRCHRDADAQALRSGGIVAPTGGGLVARLREIASPFRSEPEGPATRELRSVPLAIPRPEYATGGRPHRGGPPKPATPDELVRHRRACKAAIEVLDATAAALRPGVTGDELDAVAHEATIRRGAYPSTLNYRGYPASICVSPNEVICHGIPTPRMVLKSGDIVTIDVTVYLDGMHGDLASTYLIGEVAEPSRRLVRVTRECLDLGVAAVQPGRPVRDIGRAIQAHAHAHGYGVVRAFCGHGIGPTFHTQLQVPHYDAPEATTILEPGMTFTIEPMITAGDWHHRTLSDGWTAVTADGSRCAQFEHTIVVTETGGEVMTARSLDTY